MNNIGAAIRDEGIDAREGADVRPSTTYRVGGPAAWLVEIAASGDQLQRVARVTSAAGAATLVVGNGSNLLVADAGFDGVVVHLGEEMAGVDVDGTTVVAGGAASLPVVARRTVAAGLAGFEWAVGVPGTIGGAVRMNAGGHGSDMAASLREVRVTDLASGQDWVMSVGESALGSRASTIGPSMVVVEAMLDLRPGEYTHGERELSEIVKWRRHHQPGGQNAGSVFTNPVGDSAGRLIDIAGCKGLRIGSAEVSTKHANFIQADAGGSADDVAALMAAIRERVVEHSGVVLHAETVMVGFDPETVEAAGCAR